MAASCVLSKLCTVTVHACMVLIHAAGQRSATQIIHCSTKATYWLYLSNNVLCPYNK